MSWKKWLLLIAVAVGIIFALIYRHSVPFVAKAVEWLHLEPVLTKIEETVGGFLGGNPLKIGLSIVTPLVGVIGTFMYKAVSNIINRTKEQATIAVNQALTTATTTVTQIKKESEQKIGELTSQVSTLQGEKQQLATTVKQWENSYAAEYLDNLKGQIGTLQGEKKNLVNVNEELQKQLTKYTTENTSLQQIIERYKK